MFDAVSVGKGVERCSVIGTVDEGSANSACSVGQDAVFTVSSLTGMVLYWT